MKPLTGHLGSIVNYGADWSERYSSKFAARRAVTLACVNLGWSLDHAIETFMQDDSPARYLWESDSGHAEPPQRRLIRDWRQCERKAMQSPAWRSAAHVRQWLAELTADVSSSDWPGRTGRNDQAVMLAALAIAMHAGTSTPDLAVRSISEKAGVSRGTAGRALARLVEAGWLTHCWKPGTSFGVPQRYRVVRHDGTYNSLRPDRTICPTVTHLEHEVWLRLGKTSLAVWLALDEERRSAREVARRAGCGNRSADRWLPRLAGYLLASHNDDGWAIGRASLDDVCRNETWVEDNSKRRKRELEYIEDRSLRQDGYYMSRAEARRRADAINFQPECRICHLNHDPAEICADVIMRQR